jgi:DNA-binding LacI/PurR family transcriptional regulator
MRELARLANVSISTVSKAFGGAEDVSEETKEHVFAVARRHGCFGKFSKNRFQKHVIAIVCPELSGDYYNLFVERLQRFIENNGGISVVSAYHFDYEKQEELIDYYASYLNVDGILVFSLHNPLKRGYDVPIVSLFSAKDPTVDQVNVDLKAPMEDAIRTLYELGHRNVAFLGERLTGSKEDLFREVGARYEDMKVRVLTSDERFERAGEECADELLSEETDVTALVCAYDNIAIGAIRELKRRGFGVPEDFSVIGIDNINVSEYMETPLASIDTDPDEICMLAWELICRKQENKYYKSNREITVTGRFIPRESIGKPRCNTKPQP